MKWLIPFLLCTFFTSVPAQAQLQVVPQEGHSGAVIDAKFSRTGASLLTLGDDNQLLKWDLQSSRHYSPLGGLTEPGNKIYFLDGDEFIVVTPKYSIFRGSLDLPYVKQVDQSGFPMAKSELCHDGSEYFVAFRPWQTGDNPLLFYYPDRPAGKRYYRATDAKVKLKGEISVFHFEPESHKLFFGDDKSNLYEMDCNSLKITWLENYGADKVELICTSPKGVLVQVANLKSKKRKRLVYHRIENGKTGKSSTLAKEINLVFAVYDKPQQQFITGETVKDSFYTAIRYFNSDKEYKKAKIVWRGRRNKPIKIVATSDVMPLLAMFEHDGEYLISDTRTKSVVQKLEKRSESISEFGWDDENKQLYVLSESARLYAHIDLAGSNINSFKLPYPCNTNHGIFPDGRLIITNRITNVLYRYLPDGTKDSVPNPLSKFHEWYLSPYYNAIVGCTDKGTICVVDAGTLAVRSESPGKPGIMSGYPQLSPDGHFYSYYNLNFTGDDSIWVYSVATGKKTAMRVRENLVPDSLGTVAEYCLADSGKRWIVATAQLDTNLNYQYRIVVTDAGGKTEAIFGVPYKHKQFLPGRNRDEIMVVLRSLTTDQEFPYLLNLRKLTLDSLKVPPFHKMHSMCWSGMDRYWLLSGLESRFTGGSGGKLKFVEPGTKGHTYQMSVEKQGFAMVADDGDMLCTKGSSGLVSFDIKTMLGTRIVPGETMEPWFNKPHQVLREIESRDSQQITAYELAWQRRMRMLGAAAPLGNDGAPMVNIPLIDGTLMTRNPWQQIYINYGSTSAEVQTLHWVQNGCPRNGLAGIKLDSLKRRGRCTLDIQMVPGVNKISVWVTDIRGRNSLPVYKEIFYNAPEQTGRTVYIGIGVSKYADSSRNLIYAAKDIRDLSAWAAGLKRSSIDTLLNEAATNENLRKLGLKLKQLEAHDKVIISFSGHGLLDRNLDLYLGMHDMDFTDPSSHGLLLESLIGLLDSTPALQKLLLIDACHSGELDKEGMVLAGGEDPVITGARGARTVAIAEENSVNAFAFMKSRFEDASLGNGTVVISAAGGEEFALELAELSNGVFTHALLQCLQQKMGDEDKNGKISVVELKNYLLHTVPQLTGGRQQPTMRKENSINSWEIK
ncbi:MAG: caspase family protein [Bacteroidetes bacterium]|nr:caspase family protein [Bacteroidota bacterium]